MKNLKLIVGFMFSVAGVIFMYFSSTFVPVYVNGEYIIANQLLRYVLYIVLGSIAFYSFICILSEDSDEKKHKKNRKRRRY